MVKAGCRDARNPLMHLFWPRIQAGSRRLAWLLNQGKLILFESANLRLLELGRGCSFQVPVRTACAEGALRIGENNSFGFYMAPKLGSGSLLIQPRVRDSEIVIGNNNSFSNNVTLCANESIRIGNQCLIGNEVSIYDCDFHEVAPSSRRHSSGPMAPVALGNNVWLGSRVIVLKGVTIGDNSVIAAMSLVTKSIPANCVAAGVPARVIRDIGESRPRHEGQVSGPSLCEPFQSKRP